MSLQIIPEFAYPTERFWLSGYEDHAVHLDPTIICKHEGKAYLAHESLINFAQLITSATGKEKAMLKNVLVDLKPATTANAFVVIDIEFLKPMRDANIPLINKYLDHLELITA